MQEGEMTDPAAPRKVLMTADGVGGVWTYALELARGLAPHGIHFTIATMGPRPSAAQQREAAHLPNVSLVQSDYRLEWMEDAWGEVAEAGQWLSGLAAEVAPDLIHLNGYSHAALAWNAPVLVTAHSCVLSWWRAVKGEDAPNEWDEYRRRVTAGLRAADFVVAPSKTMLHALTENYGPLPRSGVIPNGRSAAAFRTGRKSEIIFAAGRFWDEAKNLAALEQIAGRVDWPVRIAGSAQATGNVVRLGHLSTSEIAEWLERSAIFCLPARYEPFGLSALEAALSGCALVLGDISSLREIWEDAAVFVDPNDPAKLTSALQRLIRDPKRREEMAARASRRVQQFGLEQMTDRYLSLYSALVRQFQWVEHAA
jgi:glycosyltransferase involved in cell wall biosynthesis